jgi:hypothetical protein
MANVFWTDGRPLDPNGAAAVAWSDGAPFNNESEVIGIDVVGVAAAITLTPTAAFVFNPVMVFGVTAGVTLTPTVGAFHVGWEIAQPAVGFLIAPRQPFVFNERFIPSFQARIYQKLSAVAEVL